MPNVTDKRMSQKDADQTTREAYNDVDASTTVNGFLVALVGRKVTQTIATTNVANDTAIFAFSENGTALYTITIVYTDATQSLMLTATRTA